uniref:ZAD domain-containing protein n=1 Tax=Culex tarsalis TaxID=7177 RepID=A0A1Q3FXR2_CULTA
MSVFCRICRGQIFSQPIPLSNSSLRHSKLLYDMIFECTQIMLTKNTRLPQFLCQACVIRLDEAFAFLQQCRESEQIFAKTLPAADQPEKLDLRHKTPRPLTVTDSVKLELLPSEELTVPVPFSSVAASFAATYGHVLLETSTDASRSSTVLTSPAEPNSKDWMSEARKHRERQRISTARRRANMTPEQREKERERARIRQAQRRAGRSDDEVRAQRERDRIRQAIKRAKFREVELVQQQQHQSQQVQSFALEPGINQFG